MQGLHEARSDRFRRASAAPSPAWRTRDVVGYLRVLGVTAVELLPIHAFVDDSYLVEKGLQNYWGYNSIGFFAPEPRYLHGAVRQRVQGDGHQFHAAGIEVILDVVYNHTAEGNELGPTLSFKGIDNATYYRLLPDQKRYYINDTGTGNTVNLSHPRVLQMVADSLALLGDRNARRRFPLRPRHDSRARAVRLRRGRRLSRCLPAGSGSLPASS